jgi:hypothetical protein
MTLPNPNQWLMGGGYTTAKFDKPGVSVTGSIAEQPTIQQQRNFDTGALEYWEDGNPKYQLVVVLNTDQRDPDVQDDDGTRAVYVRGNLQKAIRDAVRQAGADGLETGGMLTVTYTGDGVPSRKGINPPKMYSATYKPPAAAAAQDFLNATPGQATQQAAQYVAETPPTPGEGLSATQQEALKVLGIDPATFGK